MKRKNTNGFTLIEIIVTLVILITITVLIIIGLAKINNNKKEEAYEVVKQTIEEEAKRYVDTNKYVFEKLDFDENSTIYVSLGTLVSEDYLDKVTDPRTGKSLNKCSTVWISKNKNGSYNYDYHELKDEENCYNDYFVIVQEPGAPKISANITNGIKGNDYWYKSSAEVTINVDKNNNGDIKEVLYCSTLDGKPCENFSYLTNDLTFVDKNSYKDDTVLKTTYYEVINVFGKKAVTFISLGVETNVRMTISDKTKNSANPNNGALAFNPNNGTKYFHEIDNFFDNKNFGGKNCDGASKCYYANICKNIVSFPIYFDVSSVSTGNVEYDSQSMCRIGTDNCDESKTHKERLFRKKASGDNTLWRYYVYDYVYVTNAGNKAIVRTFEEYAIECGY